jgi:hypothetical protein
MKKGFMQFVLVSGVLLTSMHAATKAGYQPATVVSVENRAFPSNYAGGDPSDTPLQSEVYSYGIGIRLGDTVYQTSSAFDDLPSVITTNHSVQVNLKRHVIYVELPGERAVRMAIESRTGVKGVPRMARN